MHQAQWSPERPLPPPVSLASQSHHEKPPEVTCTSRGNPGFPASTRESPRETFFNTSRGQIPLPPVNPDVEVTNVKELVALAKAYPGKLNFAISGIGGAPQLAGIEFASRMGIDWTYIPYKGGADAITGVIGRQAHVLFNGMLATWPHVTSGKLRAIAISSAKRMPSAPNTPTVAEQGLPGFETGSYQGVVGPLGIPRETVAKLNAQLAKVLNTAEMKERFAKQGTEVRTDTPESLGKWLVAEQAKWAKVVKESGRSEERR